MLKCRVSLILAASLITIGLAQAQEAGMQALRSYCGPDVKRLCPGIKPGGGRIMQCLKGNEMGLTVGCAKALQSLKAKMK
jgi:hypothetical protein